jgi:hypothetical protein
MNNSISNFKTLEKLAHIIYGFEHYLSIADYSNANALLNMAKVIVGLIVYTKLKDKSRLKLYNGKERIHKHFQISMAEDFINRIKNIINDMEIRLEDQLDSSEEQLEDECDLDEVLGFLKDKYDNVKSWFADLIKNKTNDKLILFIDTSKEDTKIFLKFWNIVKSYHKNHNSNIDVRVVDLHHNKKAFQKYNITAYPVIIFDDNGELFEYKRDEFINENLAKGNYTAIANQIISDIQQYYDGENML